MSKSGQDALVLLASTLCFLFDPEKHVSMRPEFVYLGVSHDLSSAGSGTVRVHILPQRHKDLVALCSVCSRVWVFDSWNDCVPSRQALFCCLLRLS